MLSEEAERKEEETYLSSPIHPPHQLRATRVFEIRQTRTLLEVVRQEEIPKSLRLCLCPQLVYDGWCFPSGCSQLCFVDAFGWDAFCFYPFMDLSDLGDGNRAEFGFDPGWDSCEGWVRVDVD
jgi:hypothetical protein